MQAMNRFRAPLRLHGSKFMQVATLPKRFYTGISDYEEDLNMWPRGKQNTIINVCNEGQRMVVERLGKLQKIEGGGYFFALPILDEIRYVIDMREKSLVIAPQACITKDNVAVQVSGNLYCQFIDPERAAYGSKNPIYAVKQHAQSSMRAAIGEMELDQILRARQELNDIIRTTVQESATAWGLQIKR
jgi:regulator of protease activity HflC (stomatin/prohibitin superfamily)